MRANSDVSFSTTSTPSDVDGRRSPTAARTPLAITPISRKPFLGDPLSYSWNLQLGGLRLGVRDQHFTFPHQIFSVNHPGLFFPSDQRTREVGVENEETRRRDSHGKMNTVSSFAHQREHISLLAADAPVSRRDDRGGKPPLLLPSRISPPPRLLCRCTTTRLWVGPAAGPFSSTSICLQGGRTRPKTIASLEEQQEQRRRRLAALFLGSPARAAGRVRCSF